MAAEALRPFPHLSPFIALKQHFLTVDMTVKLARADTKLPVFKCLPALETIEWELSLGVRDINCCSIENGHFFRRYNAACCSHDCRGVSN